MRAGLLLALFVPAVSLGQPPPGYYDQAAGFTGPALREALNAIISGHIIVDNSALWGAFEVADDKPDGSVWDMYSDVPGGTPSYVYQFTEDQCGTYDSEGDCFNREHSFPQSWYGSSAPMSTDLFHLYPTDAWVNQQRGNWAYGKVSNPNWTGTNGSKRGPCAWPDCAGTVFEPIDSYKGDLARSYFYMLTRYLPQLGGWDSPMMASGELQPWAESLLLSWNALDPVSSKELDRNNTVYAIQNNRNPYIDNPEWVVAIWGPTASIEAHEVFRPRIWSYEGILVVEFEQDHAPTEIRIVDVSGRLVHSAALAGRRSELHLDLTTGLYFALVGSQGSGSIQLFLR